MKQKHENTAQVVLAPCRAGSWWCLQTYLSLSVLWQAAGLELFRQDSEQLQQCQAACPAIHPSPLFLKHPHHLWNCAWPRLGHCVECQRGQGHTQAGEYHLGARGEAGNLGEQLGLQRLVLICGYVWPIAGNLGMECTSTEVLDLWHLWQMIRKIQMM